MSIQCALCHSTGDDSLMKGIGRRLDGWPNRDLDIGRIVASAPTLKPFADLLGVDEGAVRGVLIVGGLGGMTPSSIRTARRSDPMASRLRPSCRPRSV
jgi:hypothetical protein